MCTILAEIWFLFRKENYSSTKLERLGYCPDASVVQKFWRLCERQLSISGIDLIVLVLFFGWEGENKLNIHRKLK